MVYVFLIFIALMMLYMIVLKPLIPMVLLKLKFGDKTSLFFFPILGSLHTFQQSLKRNGDAFGEYKKIIFKNPNKKFFIENIMTQPFLLFVDKDYQKEVYQNHQNYKKLDVIGDKYLYILYFIIVDFFIRACYFKWEINGNSSELFCRILFVMIS